MKKSTRQAKQNAKQRKQNTLVKHENALAVKHAATRAADKQREIDERRRHAMNWTPGEHEQAFTRTRRNSGFFGGFGEALALHGMLLQVTGEYGSEPERPRPYHKALPDPNVLDLDTDQYTVKKD